MSLELHNRHARYPLKIEEIQRRDIIPEMQCSHADQQIFKCELDAFCLFLALNSSGQPRDFKVTG